MTTAIADPTIPFETYVIDGHITQNTLPIEAKIVAGTKDVREKLSAALLNKSYYNSGNPSAISDFNASFCLLANEGLNSGTMSTNVVHWIPIDLRQGKLARYHNQPITDDNERVWLSRQSGGESRVAQTYTLTVPVDDYQLTKSLALVALQEALLDEQLLADHDEALISNTADMLKEYGPEMAMIYLARTSDLDANAIWEIFDMVKAEYGGLASYHIPVRNHYKDREDPVGYFVKRMRQADEQVTGYDVDLIYKLLEESMIKAPGWAWNLNDSEIADHAAQQVGKLTSLTQDVTVKLKGKIEITFNSLTHDFYEAMRLVDREISRGDEPQVLRSKSRIEYLDSKAKAMGRYIDADPVSIIFSGSMQRPIPSKW